MKKVIAFLKAEVVLTVAMVLAVISMFIVKPDAAYAEYIDFHTAQTSHATDRCYEIDEVMQKMANQHLSLFMVLKTQNSR